MSLGPLGLHQGSEHRFRSPRVAATFRMLFREVRRRVLLAFEHLCSPTVQIQIFLSLKPATGEAGSCVGSAWRRVLAVGVWRLAGIGHWSDAAGAALGHLAVVAGIC